MREKESRKNQIRDGEKLLNFKGPQEPHHDESFLLKKILEKKS